MDKHWKKDAPKWVINQVDAEIAEKDIILSLRWPTESEPKADFGFGGYDHEWGNVEHGEFWVSNGVRVTHTFIRSKKENEHGWKKLRFSLDGIKWTDSVERGHYFKTEKEASLHVLWDRCRSHARELRVFWKAYEASE